MNRTAAILAGIGTAIAVGAVVWWRFTAQPPQATSAPPAAASPPVAAIAPASAAPEAPAIQHPLDLAATEGAPTDAASILIGLLGRPAVDKQLLSDDFAHRFVATVENLGGPSATARLWPVVPMPGRFAVRGVDGTLAPDNGLRYAAFVQLIESVDAPTMAAAYRRLYPQLQQAYEDLGYPKRYFNDRVVEVIDLLLHTPESDAPLHLHLPQITAPEPPRRPWVLYEFDDPALQSLSAGQKILLRIGPVNERRLKTRLRELRTLITAPPTAR